MDFPFFKNPFWVQYPIYGTPPYTNSEFVLEPYCNHKVTKLMTTSTSGLPKFHLTYLFFRLQGEPCPVHEADIITMLLHAKAYIEAGENPGAHKKLQDVTFGL